MNLTFDNRFGAIKFINCCHHREHDTKVMIFCGFQHRAQLRAQQTRAIKPNANGAPSKRRIFFLTRAHIGKNFVAPNIEGTKCYRLLLRSFQNGTIKADLFTRIRHACRHHELQFGSKKADAISARVINMR